MITHRYTSKGGALVGKSGVYRGCIIRLGRYSDITIGRDPALCDVVISTKCSKISRVHCTVSYDLVNNHYVIKDVSANGTTIVSADNDKTMIKGQTMKAYSKSLICLGDNTNSFELL